MLETHELDRNEFEETYYDITSRFQELIISRGATSNPVTETRPANINRNRVSGTSLKLPKIDLPSFSGSYEEWYPFHDTFQSLIHRDRSINEIQKFHYLKAALKGKAAELVQSLEMSADNYEQAWQMLIKRYDNKRLIIQKHLRALFKLPSVTKENFNALRQLVDGVLKHIRALKAMGRPTDSWGDLIIHLVTGKLDHNTNKEWEDSITGNDIPTLQHLTEFLEHRCHTSEAINRKGSSLQTQVKVGQAKVSALVSTKTASCQRCKKDHQIYSCKQFLDLSPEDRLNFIKEAKLCWNCLKASSHTARNCRYGNCKTCGKRHNSLLHISGDKSETKVSESSNQTTTQQGNASTTNVAHTTMSNVTSQVFLSTALVNVRDCQGNKQTCRILLDSGSQSNFITKDLVQRLGLTVKPIDISIVGVNHACSQVKRMTQVQLSSRFYAYNIIINCLILKITERLPTISMDKTNFKLSANLPIADPEFNQSKDIDILLGAEIFWGTLCVGQIKETAEHPLLQKTLFGWVLSGRYPNNTIPMETIQCNIATSHVSLEQAIERFWQTEQISSDSSLTTEERECEAHYKENYRRTDDGSFIVKLPIKKNGLQTLGRSYDVALKRFHALENRLSRHPEMKTAYTQFMQEYIELWFAQNATEWCIKNWLTEQKIPEARGTTTTVAVQQEILEIFNRYSTLDKLIRVQGYILRFIHNCRSDKSKRRGDLSAIEIDTATYSLVRMVQTSAFSSELKHLLNHQPLPRSSKLLSLTPVIDEQGILRVGGRLQRANLPYSARHQMLLPSKHPFTKLLIENEHSRLRVQSSRPFSHVGVDFCGPFYLRESKRRNSRTNKSYVAIFVCLATKAVHVEMAFDLSAEGFIHVLRRFIGRRGKPSDIYSDNATNFVGTDRELKKLHEMFTEEQRKLTQDCATQGVQWHFIPPRAPHFGGIWEAAVRSFKTHFRKVVGETLLTTDEMLTLSIQIEAILNSRPITVLSSDPNDLTYLSPGHFLIGDVLTDVPEPTLLNVQDNRLSCWQRVDQMRQHLWKRWSKDYLHQLQQRTKWRVEDINVTPGSMVLIKEDNTPPLHWPLGRILEVHPGDDGIVRAATIKTTKGTFKRAANRLSLLPVEQ
ncbi:hypothetical protein ALC57_02653 [Trachymyrmex cornetzi]|uniref:Integrase catalytic domain-containing protein n=1 Tax=Trachymyrmex cornetzi TaxID=471704 RepID=A0A151JNR8_9HYME|nr:hypothetical protein ALC57_02653 [Trachymyrmex cornetzi]